VLGSIAEPRQSNQRGPFFQNIRARARISFSIPGNLLCTVQGEKPDGTAVTTIPKSRPGHGGPGVFTRRDFLAVGTGAALSFALPLGCGEDKGKGSGSGAA